MSSGKIHASGDFFLSPDFHELWCSMMNICLCTEIKRQWAMLVLGWVTAVVHYSYQLMALRLMLVDRNTFGLVYYSCTAVLLNTRKD